MKIYKEHSDALIPTKNCEFDAGWDVYAYQRAFIPSGERRIVEVGIRIIAPRGYYYTFAPRSGMAFKDNVIPSHHNVMDDGYTGECSVLMYNRGVKDYVIQKGDRFCQIVFYRVPIFEVELISKNELDEIRSDRGEDGFGSSSK